MEDILAAGAATERIQCPAECRKWRFSPGSKVNHIGGDMPAVVMGRTLTGNGRELYQIFVLSTESAPVKFFLGDYLKG
ncbi:hypothetical protein [Mesorhizobium sp. DCY119]|uniref:hypothetical protein n=1 Tax=Mesorhizobium sp. DCY119 TaxID=2108445 RepID=UPI000E6B6C3F|nr:hypothetical protein [Mesorhizobium sp. DCY119]RJG46478.1 hypothetical protein D3Y55_21015 [Mesorhizobium sp. DCY119]